ncbi:MAG TPA: hypothetical protein VMO00_09155 [Methylomirabilota bacterium]|nr:hypothetical protein [Methylomirabilota bacterium]HUK39397.1 hypothetical protein [Candidatus Acidoferrales bacterium]
MWKSFAVMAVVIALSTGCMSQGQFLASRQPTAIQTAVSRGQFDLNCPSATGQVLSQEVTQPPLQGPMVQGEERGLFTIGVEGCGRRQSYQVVCPMGGDGCTALETR